MRQIIWGIIFLGVAVIDVLIALRSRNEKNRAGRMLGYCLFCAAIISAFYYLSVSTSSYFLASLASSIYFCFIDFMLLYLIQFFYALLDVRTERQPWESRISAVLQVLVLFDAASLILNPFTEHAISYHLIENWNFARFSFDPHLCYRLHLLLCYLMIAYGFALLIHKAHRIPSLYRTTYRRVILCVLAVVLMNGIYLLQVFPYNLDVSILFYSLLGYGVYISVFLYGDRLIMERVCRKILECSDQPLLIFDYNDRLFFENEAAGQLFSKMKHRMATADMKSFAELLDMKELAETTEEKLRFYWTMPAPNAVSYICDYQALRDKKNKVLAKTVMFTNNTLGSDPLTGFQTEQYFHVHNRELSTSVLQPVGVAVCDLNRLSLLNNVLGYSTGDRAIALQAELIRKHFSGRTVFARLHDAKLCAICYGLSQDEIKKRLNAASKELQEIKNFSTSLKMDFAICMLEEKGTAYDAAAKAVSILKTRKLLDEESNAAGVIEALKQMLIECDPETESHVRRTRILGENLSYSIGLSAYERDQLSLLCLFHDIGKVGIPLDILNKPGPLTGEEWVVMKDHVQKGYRIARATAGLEIIAEPILHHHERWDGNGYPDGLQNEAIPILSRIISVVDAYDAMVSDRPYRKGILPEEALQELARCSGTQFDPYIADAFVRMMRGEINAERTVGAERAEDINTQKGAQYDIHNRAQNDNGNDAQDGARSDEQNDVQNDAQNSAQNAAQNGTQNGARGNAGNAAQNSAQKSLMSTTPLPSKMLMVSPVRYTRYVIDAEGTILQVDDDFERLTGYTSYDVQTHHMTQGDLMFEEDRDVHWNMVQELNKKDNTAYLEHRIRCKDGTGRYVYCVGLLQQVDGKEQTTVIVTDITDSISAQMQVGAARNRAMMDLRRLEETIQKDPMTGLLNKVAFHKNCERELLNEAQQCVLLMMDIDDFKKYNDTYGHPKGDELLMALTRALLDAVNPEDLVGRMGGDEFICLLKFKAGEELSEMIRRVHTLWQDVSKKLENEALPSSVSAGAVCKLFGRAEFHDLYEKADACLYQAKRKGKRQLCIDGEDDNLENDNRENGNLENDSRENGKQGSDN